MHTALRATLAMALAIFAVLAAPPAAMAAVPPDQAETIMKRSGLWDQLGSVLPQARVGFSAALSLCESEPTNEEADRLHTALEKAYGADELRELGLMRMSQALDAAQVKAMRRWYESPLGRKIAQVEQAAATTQTDLRAVIQQGSEVFDRLPAARRDLLGRLLQELGADEAMVEVSIHTLVSAHKGVVAALTEVPSTLTNEEVQDTLRKDRDGMLKAYKQLILASFAQAYAPLSDRELARYVAFLHSSAGKRHTQLASDTLKAALAQGAERFLLLAPAAMQPDPVQP